MKNLFEYFFNSYENNGNNNYVFDGKYWTYADAYHYIKLMILSLTEAGLKLNDRVLLYLDNSFEYIVCYFSVLYLGGTVIPVTTSSTFQNISYIIKDCKPSLLLTSSRLSSKLESEIDLDVEVKLVDVDRMSNQDAFNVDMEKYSTGKLAMIIYTSGTTSYPKGVMLTHDNLLANTDSILSYLPVDNSSSVLVVLPFGYSYGNSLLLTHTKIGALLYLSKEASFPQMVILTLSKEKITGFSTVGSYLKILLNQDNFSANCFKNLTYITLAGEQTSKSDLRRLRDTYPILKIFVMYGQTEASARITYLNPCMLNTKLGSIGKPIKNVSIKIVDESGVEVEPEEIGEIIVKGNNVMLGYLNQPDGTEKAIQAGWLYTGDLAYKDDEGYIYIVGRKNDIFKHLGHRISPLEIENTVNMSDNILESAIIDHRDSEGNVKIVAYVVLEKKENGIGDLPNNVRSALPLYKIPAEYFVIDELPKTSSGKIKRMELKKQLDL